MEDQQIVNLYWQRSSNAISESSAKYGGYCHAIAYRILGSYQDAEECVNDTWVGAWNAMPVHRPACLTAFLGKITRRAACNHLDALRAESGVVESCRWCWRNWQTACPPLPTR